MFIIIYFFTTISRFDMRNIPTHYGVVEEPAKDIIMHVV